MSNFPLQPPVFDGKSRKVGFENVMGWLQQGWFFFRDHPGFWILVTVLFLIIMGVSCMVPWIGPLIAIFFTPLLATGLLQACKNISDGNEPEIKDLFAGFSSRTGALIVLGLFSVVVLILFSAVLLLVVGDFLGKADSTVEVLLGLFALFFLVPLALALLLSPVFMAIWFAPALVYFNSLSAGSALKASFVACLRNIWQFLFYGLIVFLLLFLSMLTAGIGLLVLLPVISGSVYASYHDIFLAN